VADFRSASLSFRPPARVTRDEEFDERIFDDAARPAAPAAREGLPAGYRMRHDEHYVDHLTARQSGQAIQFIPVGEIEGRHPVGQADLAPLVESIATYGVLQPILVRRQDGRFQLIAGTRRLAAAMAAGLSEVPCLVHLADDARALAIAEADNLREQPDPRPVEAAIPAGTIAQVKDHLASMAACLQLFVGRDRPLRERVALELIEAELQRAAWLAAALEVFGEPAPAVWQPTDLGSLLDRVLLSLQAEQSLTGLEIDAPRECAGPMVRGDEQQLALALAGMMAGVRTFLGGVRSPRVSVAVTTESNGRMARVEVSQAPAPVAGETRGRFFDPAWAERPGGARGGVLVAAARRVAELHGGTLDLVVHEPAGCSLVLTVPTLV
jgi:hypothetical protein